MANNNLTVIDGETLADISILLVHHLRKQGAADPLNKLSGTTGIAGAVDAVLVLEKSDRWASTGSHQKISVGSVSDGRTRARTSPTHSPPA